MADAQQLLDSDDPVALLSDLTAAPIAPADVFLSEPFYAALESLAPWSQLRYKANSCSQSQQTHLANTLGFASLKALLSAAITASLQCCPRDAHWMLSKRNKGLCVLHERHEVCAVLPARHKLQHTTAYVVL